MNRKCQRCERVLDIRAFPSNPAYRDGKGVTCRECKSKEIERQFEILGLIPING